jgi:hypothetical protein
VENRGAQKTRAKCPRGFSTGKCGLRVAASKQFPTVKCGLVWAYVFAFARRSPKPTLSGGKLEAKVGPVDLQIFVARHISLYFTEVTLEHCVDHENVACCSGNIACIFKIWRTRTKTLPGTREPNQFRPL